MWFIKANLLLFLILVFFLLILFVFIPDKYMDMKGLNNYTKDVKNKINKNQKNIINDLNSIK